MSNLHIDLEVNHQPVRIEMLAAIIQQQQFKADPYGQTAANRLVLSNATQVACLFVDERLYSWELKRLAGEFKWKQPRIVRLGDPILAIHYLEAGRGWPEDAHSDPVSILNSLPVEQWAWRANQPSNITHHPLIHQPAGSVVFQCPMSAGMPVTIHHDSIATVTQVGNSVFISIRPEANLELLGLAVVRLNDERAAMGLAEGFRLRRVRRISHNELVRSILLCPKPHLCRGHQTPVDWRTWDSCSSRQQLLRIIQETHPDALRNAMAEMMRPQ